MLQWALVQISKKDIFEFFSSFFFGDFKPVPKKWYFSDLEPVLTSIVYLTVTIKWY
jgi:hypothetical protein